MKRLSSNSNRISIVTMVVNLCYYFVIIQLLRYFIYIRTLLNVSEAKFFNSASDNCRVLIDFKINKIESALLI